MSDPSIQDIEEIEEGKFKVNVIDKFHTYSQVTTEWTISTRNVTFLVVKINDKWLVDKYDFTPTPGESIEKYDGFGHW